MKAKWLLSVSMVVAAVGRLAFSAAWSVPRFAAPTASEFLVPTETRLEVNSYSQIGHQFGASVAIYGDTAVVGVPLYNDVFQGQGAVYLYERVGTTWVYDTTLLPADPRVSGHFGLSVAIDGDTIVVGAQGRVVIPPDPLPVPRQSAYVFVRTAGVWSQLAKLTASDELLQYADSFDFGRAVSISGDTIVVGAPDCGVAAEETGCAYVFVRSGTIWTEQSKLIASDAGFLDQFGSSVEIDGDTVVIGAPRDDVDRADQGSAYVFVRSGTTWLQQGKLVAADGQMNDNFGIAVAVNGETVAVGSNYDGGPAGPAQGSAYVFVRSGSLWSQQAKLTASDASEGDFFGISVSVDVDTIVVGARLDDGAGGADQGSAYVFTRAGATWSQQAKVTAPGAAADDYFGSSVAVNGDTVIAGAPGKGTNEGPDEGTAYVYVRSGSSWTHQVPWRSSAAIFRKATNSEAAWP